MKEPVAVIKENGWVHRVPYSALTPHDLAAIVIGIFQPAPTPEFPECYDPEFRRRYAAILLVGKI